MDVSFLLPGIIVVLAIAGSWLWASYQSRRKAKTTKLSTPKPSTEWRHCPWCAATLTLGDIGGKKRLKCSSCRFVHWNNPLPVAITLVPTTAGGAILVKRNIPPKVGMLALPGGYIEPHETPETAAQREVKEETGLDVEIERLLLMTMPSGVNEILMFFLAKPTSQQPTAGDGEGHATVVDRDTLATTELAFQTHRQVVELWLSGEQY